MLRHRHGWAHWRAALLGIAATTCFWVSASAQPTSTASAYLMARVALERSDFEVAAKNYLIVYDRLRGQLTMNNVAKLNHTLVYVLTAAGAVETAIDRSYDITPHGHHRFASVSVVQYVDAMQQGKFRNAREAMGGFEFIGDLLTAWALAGEQQFGQARARLLPHMHASNHNPMFTGIVQYHLGLLATLDPVNAVTPDWTIAESNARLGPLVVHARAAHTPVAEARARYFRALQQWPNVPNLRNAFLRMYDAGFRPRTVATPRAGAAEALFTFGMLAETDQQRYGDPLVYFRLADFLRPDDSPTTLALGNTLLSWQRAEEAHRIYQHGNGDVVFAIAAAEALEASMQHQRAVEMLSQFGYRLPQDALALYHLGELYRRHENYAAARLAYDQAFARLQQAEQEIETIERNQQWYSLAVEQKLQALAEVPDETRLRYQLAYLDLMPLTDQRWQLHYARGVSRERLGQWPAAEVDLLRALDLHPDHPGILNYLAYSWVDQGVNLDRSMQMLEQAVRTQPNNGAIVDSVGWAQYKMGNYESALVNLERALELAPDEAEINDHLGDVLWQLNRRDEARVYWRRALTWEPDDRLREAIELKLRDGLGIAAQQ